MRARREKRVLFVVRWPVGGIRTYLRELLRQPCFDSLDITIVLPRSSEAEALVQESGHRDVQWRWVDNTTRALSMGATREILRGSYSLVHAHGITAAVCAYGAARIRRLPLLVTVHEVFTRGQYEGGAGRLKRAFVEFILKGFKRIHAVSADAARNIVEFMPRLAHPEDRIAVIKNGIDVERFANCQKRDLKTELGLDEQTAIFGFFGRFMAPKGFRVLIRAVELLAQREQKRNFVVVCVGGGGFIREDRATVEQLGLASLFRFLPFEREIGPTIKGVDAVVMPSLWEAGPLLPMEAMVCGVPLIASNCVGLRETVVDTPARVVQAGDAEALARAMEEELASPSFAAARNFVSEAKRRFDARRSYGQLKEVYRQLIGE